MFLRRPDLLVAIGKGGVDILDTSFPSNPPIMVNIDSPGETMGVWESPDREYIFLADNNIEEYSPDPADEDALWVADRNYLSNENVPLITSWPDDPGTITEVRGLWGSEDRLYFWADQLYIFDISVPETPVLLGSASIPASKVLVEGDQAYYLTTGGFGIMDCSFPEAPVVTGEFFSADTSRIWRGFDVEGDFAYITDGRNLRVLDISYPDSISEVASIMFTEETTRVYSEIKVIDTYAFLGSTGKETQMGGLVIVDVTYPLAMNIMGDRPDDFITGFEGFRDEMSPYFYLYAMAESLSGVKQFCVYRIAGLD
jgi:hypothetical protein